MESIRPGRTDRNTSTLGPLRYREPRKRQCVGVLWCLGTATWARRTFQERGGGKGKDELRTSTQKKNCQSDAVHEIPYMRVGPLGGKLSLFTSTREV
jgi:hypothetical protein